MIFTKELLTTFVHMEPNEWRSLTIAMGVMYRVRLNYRETHIVDRVQAVFGDDVPDREQWNEVKFKVNKVRRQVRLARQIAEEENGAASSESPRAKKRAYQKEYMRRRRKATKASLEGDT